jgi:hypothetical protein
MSGIHIVNPFRNPFGGSEQRALMLYEQLRGHTEVRLWSLAAADPHYAERYPISPHNWLRHLEDLAEAHRGSLESLGDDTSRLRLLATLNVVQQVVNVAQTTILQDAWERDQAVTIHGWIYGLEDGLLRDLGVSVQRGSDVQDVAQAAFGRLAVLEGGVVAT